jgi:transposase
VDADGMPVRVFVTDGTTADCTKAGELIKDIKARYLIADKGYDSDEVIRLARKKRMVVVIPPKRNRNVMRYHYKGIYKHRHKVENAFLKMKQWRGIATRYCKNVASFIAGVQICCLMVWLSASIL